MHRGGSGRFAKPGSLIFGTDGVRARPGDGYLREDSIRRIAAATATCLDGRAAFPGDFVDREGRVVLVARDTRESGAWILGLLADAFGRRGYEVFDAGVLPTPGSAWVASLWPEVALAVVISASHNPAEYNGIKFLAPTGAKISPEFERAVSDAYWREPEAGEGRPGVAADRASDAFEAYCAHLVSGVRRPDRLRGKRIFIDTANGAASGCAPEVFRRLGMEVSALADRPDGRNINLGCGALHPEGIASAILGSGAPVGLCFDGDGDRVIPVGGAGTILDGDHILYLAGRSLPRDPAHSPAVVATVMSNIGLELALRREGVGLLRTDVGDRNVYLAMVEGGHTVGGEQSGHIIFLDAARTGDGLLAGLRLLDLLGSDELSLESEAAGMTRYPQLLRNVRVHHRRDIEDWPEVSGAIERAQRALDGLGRVLVRYSGTEPLLRVMLEGPDQEGLQALAEEICSAARDESHGKA